MSKLREEIKYVQNKVKEQISGIDNKGLNFNETIELCLNKNFKQLYMAIEKSAERGYKQTIDENPWRDCGKLERAAHLIAPINLDDISFRDYISSGPGEE